MEDMIIVTYVSFADLEQCFGVVILHGIFTAEMAIKETKRLGLYPASTGCDTVAMQFSNEDEDIPIEIFQKMFDNANRLIPPDEARELFEAKMIEEFTEKELSLIAEDLIASASDEYD